MFWKNVVGTLNESWRDSVKPAVMDALRNSMDGLRNPDPNGMLWAQLALAHNRQLLHPAPQPQKREEPVAAPQAKPAARRKPSSRTVERGGICVQIKDEMHQILYITREGGRSIKEIRAAKPNFRFWDLVESDALSDEDREVALHPNRWETGYSALLLSKLFKVKTVTIRDYITAYNRTVRKKKTSR